jgi:hypothetical protein
MASGSMKKKTINHPKLSEGARRTLRSALVKFTSNNRHHSMSWDDNLAAVIELYENGFIIIEITPDGGMAVRLT